MNRRCGQQLHFVVQNSCCIAPPAGWGGGSSGRPIIICRIVGVAYAQTHAIKGVWVQSKLPSPTCATTAEVLSSLGPLRRAYSHPRNGGL